jgi:hypothetical protein
MRTEETASDLEFGVICENPTDDPASCTQNLSTTGICFAKHKALTPITPCFLRQWSERYHLYSERYRREGVQRSHEVLI